MLMDLSYLEALLGSGSADGCLHVIVLRRVLIRVVGQLGSRSHPFVVLLEWTSHRGGSYRLLLHWGTLGEHPWGIGRPFATHRGHDFLPCVFSGF